MPFGGSGQDLSAHAQSQRGLGQANFPSQQCEVLLFAFPIRAR